MTSRAALLLGGALAMASCRAPPEPTARGSQAVIGGAADTSDVAVVALQQPSTGMLCSGTLVSPSLVLTAAHCVLGIDPSTLQVVVGSDVTVPDQTVAVTSTLSYPTYAGESEGLLGGVDLAFVTLATPLSTPTPVAIRTDTTDAELTDADVTVVGYGATDGTDNSGTGTRRAVVLAVTTVCSRLLQAGDADANACEGDSGGAVLLGGKLVAVVSGGQPGCYTPAVFTRTDAHADWIAAVLAGSGAASCPTCVAPDPSCTAATETRPAGEPADAADEAAPDASRGTPHPGGGCDVSGDAAEARWVVAMAAVVGVALRRKKKRAYFFSSSPP